MRIDTTKVMLDNSAPEHIYPITVLDPYGENERPGYFMITEHSNTALSLVLCMDGVEDKTIATDGALIQLVIDLLKCSHTKTPVPCNEWHIDYVGNIDMLAIVPKLPEPLMYIRRRFVESLFHVVYPHRTATSERT